MSDPLSSSLNLFQYADDIALTYQARKFEECEIHLEEGLEILSRFFHQGHLRPNPSKTVLCFTWKHIMPTESYIAVQFDNPLITHVEHLKYLVMIGNIWTERFEF
jgi:hypothetical protein